MSTTTRSRFANDVRHNLRIAFMRDHLPALIRWKREDLERFGGPKKDMSHAFRAACVARQIADAAIGVLEDARDYDENGRDRR